MNAIDTARRTMRLEGDSILAASERVGDEFTRAVDILAVAERVIVSGIGKSGAIAQKIAATLTSTGTPATWLHPVESLHGDLGIVNRSMVAIILSKSGETEELFGLVAALARLDVPVVAITGRSDSTLARAATVALDASVQEEACPLDLAPTTSTAVALALGDALALSLLERKGFGAADFARFHPGGRLGRKLLLRVSQVMVPPGRPLTAESSMREVIVALAHDRGMAVIIEDATVAGVITAGDLTRLVERTDSYLDCAAMDVMSTTPRLVLVDDLASTAVGMMERNRIIAAPVVDANGKLQGVVHLHDLLQAGAV